MMSPLNTLLLDIQRALLDAVVAQLRAVTADVDIKDKKLILYFFYDGEISDELFDLVSVAATEAGGTLSDYFTDEHCLRLDYPKKIPIQGRLVYLRKEPIPQEYKRYEIPSPSERLIPIAALLLHMQQALLGKVTPDLRAVAGDIDPVKKTGVCQFYYDQEISEESVKLATAATEEVRKGLPDYRIEIRLVRSEFPEKISIGNGRYAYFRKEPRS